MHLCTLNDETYFRVLTNKITLVCSFVECKIRTSWDSLFNFSCDKKWDKYVEYEAMSAYVDFEWPLGISVIYCVVCTL